MKKIAILSLASGITLMLSQSAVADEKQLEKRLEALEAKMEHMSAIEAENKLLKARLQKTEAKLEQVTAQKIVSGGAPVRTVGHEVTPVGLAMPATNRVITKSTPTSHNNWSGIYAGINAGYGTGDISNQSNSVDNYASPQYTKLSTISTYDGPLVGGQIGYNYEFANKLILGAETDIDYADINRWSDRNNNSNSITVSSPLIYSSNQYARTGINWLGTARLRLGYDLGNFMPYLTGGFAYGGVSSNNLIGVISNIGNGNYSSQIVQINAGSNSSVQTGWAAGAGAELKVADHWSIRGEYLFTQLEGLSVVIAT